MVFQCTGGMKFCELYHLLFFIYDWLRLNMDRYHWQVILTLKVLVIGGDDGGLSMTLWSILCDINKVKTSIFPSCFWRRVGISDPWGSYCPKQARPCYDFDWFRLYSRDQRQSKLKTFGFQRLKRMLWVLFQSIVLRSSYVQVKGLSNED